MKVKIEKVKGADLKPGDLFVSPLTSVKDVEKMFENEMGVGIFVRTEQPLPFEDSAYQPVLKVTIL